MDKNNKYHIGCSGFYYKEWKGIFYPETMPAKDWFKFYCRYFNTIEINSSFYHMPSLASLEKWYRDSPEDFLFTIKAPRAITHLRRFNVEKDVITGFYELVSAGLKEKLGNILFQMPPSFSYTPERLQLICRQLNSDLNNVVEFRHESWWQQEILDTLQKHHIIFCGQSYPGELPEMAVINNKTAYYRFHGKPVLYKSRYEKETLQQLLDQVKNKVKRIFIYFNNTWGDAALQNGRQMQEIVAANV